MNNTSAPPPSSDRQLAQLYRIMAPLLAAGILLSGLTLTLFTGHPIGGWLVISMLLMASLLIGHPRRFLLVFFGFVVIHPTLQNFHGHWLLQLTDKLLGLLLLGVVIVNFIKNRTPRPELRVFNRLLFGFLMLAVASAVINRVSPIAAFRFFLTYGTFIPAFYAAYQFTRPEEADARTAMTGILIVFAVQLVLNTGWALGINPLPNHAAGTEDFAIGTLGLCNVVAYLTAAVFFVLFGVFHAYPNLKMKLLSAGAGILAMFQMVITFTFHALPPLAGLLIFQSLYAVKALRYKLAMVVLAGIIAGSFVYIKSNPRLSRAFGFPAEDFLTLTQFRVRWDRMWRGNKGRAYYNIFVRAREDMPAWIVGAGPGNFASGIGMVHRSMLAEKYVNYIYLTYSGRREMIGGSITQHVTTGYSAIYSEFGPFGLLLFFGLHGLAVVHVWRQFRRGAYRGPVRRVLAEAFIPTMLLYLGLNLISDFLSDTFLQTGVWLWAGIVWKADTDAPPATGEPAMDASPTTRSLPASPLPRDTSWR